jgi:hypothetical protein
MKGRGSDLNPPNRIERVHAETDFEQLDLDGQIAVEERSAPTEFLPNATKKHLREQQSRRRLSLEHQSPSRLRTRLRLLLRAAKKCSV